MATVPTREGLVVPWDDEARPLAAPRTRWSAPLARPAVVDRAAHSRWLVGARLVLALVALLAIGLQLSASRAEPASGKALVEAVERGVVTDVLHLEGDSERWLWDDGDGLNQTGRAALSEALASPVDTTPELDGDDIDRALRDRARGPEGAASTLLVRSTPAGQIGFAGAWDWVLVLMPVAVYALLLGGPAPWLGNRWAWFWLTGAMHGAYTVAVLAFALLSGPLPCVRRPLWRRRLSGWEGFALLPVVALLLWLGSLAVDELGRLVV